MSDINTESASNGENRNPSGEEEYKKLLAYKSGGRYVPPAKLKALLDQINFDKNSKEFQKIQWEKLKKNINGSINKANISNLKTVVVGLFQVNLNRGIGLLVKSVMKAQSLALPFSPVYASLICVLNSKIPKIGELLISRLVLQFKKAYKRNNKSLCISSTTFLAQLVNQQVAHEIVILQIIYLLLNRPTDDSLGIACSILKEVGKLLNEVSPTACSQVFEKLRRILQDGKVDKKSLYAIESLFHIRRDGFKDHLTIPEGLDLVEDSDQIVHKIGFDDKLKANDQLNVFQYDPNYEQNEQQYNDLRTDILGEDSDDDEDEEEYESEGEGNAATENIQQQDEDEVQVEGEQIEEDTEKKLTIKDMTETNLLNFKKTIYLILKGSMSPDEAVHKLLRLRVKYDDEPKVVDMIVKACAQETTYSKYYGVIGEKMALQSSSWEQAFKEVFKETYETIHRLESNPLRNVSKFWGHMLSCGSLDWDILAVINLTEEDTTPAGRIFIKFVFQELVEELGVQELQTRLEEEYIKPYLEGIFPVEDPDRIRFSINYFTAIGLGILTEGMRETLQKILDEDSESRGRSYSRSRSRSSSYSRSHSGSYSRSRSYNRSPSPRRHPSYTRSPSPRRDCSYSRSRSPPRRNGERSRSRSLSRSRSPPRQRYSRSQSPSYNQFDRRPDNNSNNSSNYRRYGNDNNRGRGGDSQGRGRGRGNRGGLRGRASFRGRGRGSSLYVPGTKEST